MFCSSQHYISFLIFVRYYGFGHVEIFLQENNIPTLIEINARISGASGLCHELVNAEGNNSQIDIFLNKIFDIKYPLLIDNFAQVLFLYSDTKTPLPDFKKRLDVYSEVKVVNQLIEAGGLGNKTIEKVSDAAAIILLVAPSMDILNLISNEIKSLDSIGW